MVAEASAVVGENDEAKITEENSSEDQPDTDKQKTDQTQFNQFATKKTIAQGLLDIALLTNSVSQLKYILLAGSSHQFYVVLVCTTSISIVLQVLTGIILLMMGAITRLKSRAETYNNIATVLIFLITVLNVLSTSLMDTVTTRELYCKDARDVEDSQEPS